VRQSVLIVDDEGLIRRSLTMVLEGAGYDVRSAANGADALAQEPPDCVLIDLRLGDMDGLDVLRAGRERVPMPKAIVRPLEGPGPRAARDQHHRICLPQPERLDRSRRQRPLRLHRAAVGHQQLGLVQLHPPQPALVAAVAATPTTGRRTASPPSRAGSTSRPQRSAGRRTSQAWSGERTASWAGTPPPRTSTGKGRASRRARLRSRPAARPELRRGVRAPLANRSVGLYAGFPEPLTDSRDGTLNTA
jgi:chemotaxis response regulator CheB